MLRRIPNWLFGLLFALAIVGAVGGLVYTIDSVRPRYRYDVTHIISNTQTVRYIGVSELTGSKGSYGFIDLRGRRITISGGVIQITSRN
jgi:hypothetical protein